MKKHLLGYLLLIIVSMNLTACSQTSQGKTKEMKRFWGDKKSCIEFLQSKQAVSERWILEALE